MPLKSITQRVSFKNTCRCSPMESSEPSLFSTFYRVLLKGLALCKHHGTENMVPHLFENWFWSPYNVCQCDQYHVTIS